ncbi:aldo/keto reductase [Colletotrichum orchidophilum]|uniref:Aldo/keto reductase n=1 Tax=Colletotrichum orchidophilum TaxID=1209926 RepID=A0A1G4BEU7_9PEZI|nr:aldo/keto reductase [Colletotrichum orchidophilum]OHE99856.1 aldo/keto reductase [Colletotrichum orchidophilum]
MIMGKTTFVDPWKATEALLKTDKTKAIGVSNFSKDDVQMLLRKVSVSKEAAHMARVVDRPTLTEIAKKHGKTPVQVALALGVNSGRFVIPKSVIKW